MLFGAKKLLTISLFMGFYGNSWAKPAISVDRFLKDSMILPIATNGNNDFFDELFKNNPGIFDSIRLHHIGWNVQIRYTQINAGKKDQVTFEHYYFNKKDARYFYPGMAVRLPIAILALQKFHELPFPKIVKELSMVTEAAYSGQTAQYNDPNTADGRPSIGQYIKELLISGDKNAFDRLYEFLGPEYINKQLSSRGYQSAQILHRMAVSLSEDENRHTNPVSFYNKAIRQPVYQQPMYFYTGAFEKRSNFIGKGYYKDSSLINTPMDFSKKNCISLEDLHNMMTGLLFPSKQDANKRFNITEEDRGFILKYMSQLPGESTFPSYDSSFQDAYSKFILFGKQKDSIPENIRIFNVTGYDYGQLTDVAYVVDFEKKISFIVSATIYCNRDEILNDNKYDYDSIGLPFMKELGKALYEFELKRKKNREIDLSPFIFTYDK